MFVRRFGEVGELGGVCELKIEVCSAADAHSGKRSQWLVLKRLREVIDDVEVWVDHEDRVASFCIFSKGV